MLALVKDCLLALVLEILISNDKDRPDRPIEAIDSLIEELSFLNRILDNRLEILQITVLNRFKALGEENLRKNENYLL